MPEVEVVWPAGGINRNAPHSAQPEGTTVDACNVLTYDSTDRARGGQRPGVAKLFATQLASGNIQWVSQAVTASTGGSVLTEAWPYSAGNLQTTGSTNWTLQSSTVCNFHANGDNTVSVTPLTGNGQVTVSHNANFADTLELTCTFPLTMQAGTGSGDNNTFVVQFYDAFADFLFEFDILHEHNAGTPRTTAKVVDAFTTTSSTPVSEANANGTWSITVTGLTAATVCTPTFTVKRGGVTVLTHTSGSTFYGAVANVFIKAITSQTAGSPTLTIGNPFTISATGAGRVSKLIAVAGGNIWQGSIDPNGGSNTIAQASNQSTPPLSASVNPSLTYVFTKAYAVDGTSIIQYDIPSNAVEAYTATAGSAPTGCTLACTWRGRLVLSGTATDSQNWFMSRVGTPTDWDFSQTDPSAAIAGNDAAFGKIGDRITALIPLNDDTLLMGGDHTIWIVSGDPADGGSINQVSDEVGVLSSQSYAKDPSGNVYFVGSGGLFSIAGDGTGLKNLTNQVFDQYFRQLAGNTQFIHCAWDRSRHGLWVFVLNQTAGVSIPSNLAAGWTHLFLDMRGGGLWPQQYPDTIGPVCSTVYDGDGANDRRLVLGGRDGYIREQKEANTNDDDGTAISSYCYVGPVAPGGTTANSRFNRVDTILGYPASGVSADMDVTLTFQNEHDAFSAYNAPRGVISKRYSGLPNRLQRWIIRSQGVYFFLKLSNSVLSKTWAFEKAVINFMPAGIERR